MLSYVLLCTRLSHFFLFLIIRLIYRTFTAAKGEVRIARYLERFFPVVSVLTYFYVLAVLPPLKSLYLTHSPNF